MKKVSQLILAIIVLITITSCNEKINKNKEKIKVEETKETHDSNTTLRLNNGNLWIANPETTTGINNMLALLNSFSDKENVEAYATLKQNLEEEFGTIISECTMKGEPHNQLHNFLTPFSSLFKKLESSELVVCKESFDALKKHLLTYSNYFE
ncbi:hypothetical protein [Lutibacter sp.]